MIYIILFYEFFKIGLFAVGGGLATLPFLYDIAGRYFWLTRQNLSDMIAISESTPGPMGINMSTYAGFHAAGLLGGIISTLSLVLPSFIIIVILSFFLEKFRTNKYVDSVFIVLRPAVTALIASAVFEIYKISILNIDKFISSMNILYFLDYKNFAIFAVFLAGILLLKKHPIFYIIAGAAAGLIFKL